MLTPTPEQRDDPASFTVVMLQDHCFVNGGAARIAIDEAVGLAESGHRVIFIGAVGPVCEELAGAPLKVICLNQPELLNFGKNPAVAWQGLWNFKAARVVRDVLSSLDPARTIVHMHGYTKALTTSVVRAVLSKKFRMVTTLHDFFAVCPNGGLFDYAENRPCHRRCLSLSCIARNCDKRHYVHKLYRVARSLIQKYVGRFPSGVKHYISLSNTSEKHLRPYLPPEAQFHPLENLIEVERLPPADVAAGQHVVAVGRLEPEKGVEWLIEATQRAGVSLTLVGDGPLRAKAEGAPGVRVTGWIPAAHVKEELRRARCLVFSSLWYETYGLVVGEAAACGIPAIVSDVTAAVERVQDGVHGWHARAGDVEDLARCLRLTKDDALIRAAGQAAYDRFWQNPPTRDNHLEGLVSVYRRLLAS